ncbi:MAG TPA: hypothetical protein ENN19_13865 [Chloroflexi bacterium]|nr:hypothetical protein [Chloroflexota bacterium]
MEERLHILHMIEAGEIDVEEGARQLETLAEPPRLPPSPTTPITSVSRPAWVKWIWMATLWLGIAFVAGGGYLLTVYYTREAATSRLVWGWILMVLGVLWVLLGWWMQRAQWLLVRVQQPGGPNIFIAFPLPLELIGWAMRILRPFIPQIEETGADEILIALQKELKRGQPFLVEVDEGDERVQVYMG